MSDPGYTRYGIPRSVAPFFQEYDLDNLDPEHGAATIIERILRYGNRAELRWLFQRYPRATIARWVKHWGCYALTGPRLAFWRLVLDVEEP